MTLPISEDDSKYIDSSINGITVEHYLSNLTVVENLMLAIRFSNRTAVEVVDAEAKVDLSEFKLTPQEAQKLQTILKRLNDKLAQSLEKQCSAVSIVSEVRASEQGEPNAVPVTPLDNPIKSQVKGISPI